MSILEEAAEGKLRLECSEIRLERAGSSPLNVRGPGLIEVNDQGSFNFRIHVSSEDHQLLSANLLNPTRPPGSLIPLDEFLNLTAVPYHSEEWTGRASDPGTNGPLGGPGIASGQVYELQSARQTAQTEVDCATFYLPGRLAFPALIMTQLEESRSGVRISTTGSRDSAEFEVGKEKFTLSRAGNHIELECTFELGGIKKNRHLRLLEALTFALGQLVSPAATELVSEGKRVKILRAVDPSLVTGAPDSPPIRFGSNMPVREVYDVATAYYRKVLDWEKDDEHPVSSGVYSVVQAFGGTIETQILGLSTAAESLIEAAFKDIVPIEADFRSEIQIFQEHLRNMSLSETLRGRISGAVDAMLNPRNSDRIRAFVKKRGLDPGIFEAWSKLRNRCAHGGQIQSTEMQKTWDQRCKVLRLCHQIVLAFIEYSEVMPGCLGKGF